MDNNYTLINHCMVKTVIASLIEIHCLKFSELSPEHYPTEL